MNLDQLRRDTARILLSALGLMVPVLMLVAWLGGGGMAEVLGGGALAGASAAATLLASQAGVAHPATRPVLAVALMVQVSVLVWVAPVALRLDMHMAYFAVLAVVAGLVDRRAIIFATLTVALHHTVLNELAPMIVFGGEGTLLRVAVHAGILVAEAAALIALIGGLQNAFATAGAALEDAEAARAAEKAEVARRLERDAAAAAEARAGRHALAEQVETQVGGVAGDVVSAAAGIGQAAGGLSQAAKTGMGSAQDAARATAAAAGGQTVAAAQAVAQAEQAIGTTGAAVASLEETARRLDQGAAALRQMLGATVQGLRAA